MPVIASTGHTTSVYKFELYDISKDELVLSTRMATQRAIESINAVRKGVAFEVPNADVDADGFTAKNYIPVQGAPA